MKKIRLTESDLRRIVKRVLNESTTKKLKLKLFSTEGKFLTNIDCEMYELRGTIIDFEWKVAGDGIAYVYGATKGAGYPANERDKEIGGALTIKEGIGMLKCTPNKDSESTRIHHFGIIVGGQKYDTEGRTITKYAKYSARLSEKGRDLIQQTFCDMYSSTDTEQDNLEMGGGYV